MFTSNLKPHREVVDRKKATRISALAFSICMAALPVAHAQTNLVSGTAYGTNYAALATIDSIASIANGNGSLAIGYSGTTNLTLSHTISGTIIVSNNFDHFTINATGAKVSGSDYAALTVRGGSNLTINGGQFIGTTGSAGIVQPPVPGQGSETNAVSSAARGGVIYNTTNVQITGTTFSGATYQPSTTTSYGSDGLQILDSQNVSITNGTSKGGSGADADAESLGGHALYIENSDVAITNGTYTGGAAGKAVTSTGGTALYAQDSTIEISGNGKFTGGTAAPALLVSNSDLTVNGGTFIGGSYGTGSYFGLVSMADSGLVSRVALNGGTFDSIDFTGDGTQYFTAGSGLVVSNYVVVDGGSVIVTNQSDDALQDLRIREGSISLVNDFMLASGGSLTLYSDLSTAAFNGSFTVASNATAWVGTGKITVADNFNLLEEGVLSFSIVTNNGYGQLIAGSAFFNTNSTIQIDATQAAFTYGTNEYTMVSTTTSNGLSLYSGSATNAVTAENITNNVNAYTAQRTSLSDILLDGGTNLVFRFVTQTFGEYWNATGQFAAFADEIKDSTQMALLIDQYHSASLSAMAVEQTYFTTFNNLQIALQGMRSAVGQSISRGTEFRDQLKLIPSGSRLRSQKTNNMRGWVKYYGQYYSHDQDGLNPEYDSVLHGGTVGIDTSIGNLLVGVSGGSSRYRIDHDVKAQSDTIAYQGNLYATYGMEKAYIDAGLAYSRNQVDTRTAQPFVLDGSFDADMASAYLGGGYDLVDTKGGTVFTPEASIQYTMYQQDAYTEESTVAIPRVIDAFDANSLLSSVGMNVSMLRTKRLQTFGLKIDGRLHWMHEFNSDPGNLNFMLQGGSNSYSLSYPTLDENIYRVGIGATFFNTIRSQPKNVMLRFDFDELFGDGFNSHNLAAKLVYAF